MNKANYIGSKTKTSSLAQREETTEKIYKKLKPADMLHEATKEKE